MSLTFDVYGTAALFDRVGRAMFALGDGTVRFEDGGQGGREWKRRGEGSPRLVSPAQSKPRISHQVSEGSLRERRVLIGAAPSR